MSHITLADIETAHKTVAELIATFKAQAPRLLSIAHVQIELQQGEHYAGVMLGADGAPSHHLVLLDGAATDVEWQAAKDFAARTGGELPTRREQALLFANLKGEFEERAYWSGEQHAANADYAWGQNFSYGNQGNGSKSASLRARAVRRLTIS